MPTGSKHKTLIFIVSYNAEAHIEKVLNRIVGILPDISGFDYEVLIIDDASKDKTVEVAEEFKKKNLLNLTILKNPVNQGYGGNQKIGYQYAIKFGFDSVILLHGDNQYPPECIKDILNKFLHENAEMVLGSRMLDKKLALKGKMPIYKFFGNMVITKLQNTMLRTNFSEFHTGFKGYSAELLKRIPFEYNSNDFDFDTDIIIQAVLSSAKTAEVPIPTHYGDEICNVDGKKYAFQVIRNTFLAKVQRYSIYYHPKYDFKPKDRYESKIEFDSSHSFAVSCIEPNSKVLDINNPTNFVAKALKEKNCEVVSINKAYCDPAVYNKTIECDVDNEKLFLDSLQKAGKFDSILLLDTLENFVSIESVLKNIRNIFANDNTKVVVTTANIGFILVRLSLLLGNFSYGKRGLLDMDHKRLYTFYSLKRLLKLNGYNVEKTVGIPIPFELFMRQKKLARFLTKFNRLLMKVSRSLFSYQVGMVIRPTPTLEVLMERAKNR